MNEAASCQHLCQTFQTTGCYSLVQVILWKTSRFLPKHASRAPTLVLSTMEAVQSYVSSMEHILFVLVHMEKWQLVALVKVRGILLTDCDVWHHVVFIVGVLNYWWLGLVTILDKIILKSYTCFSMSWGRLDCELDLWQEQSLRSKIWPNDGWLEQINAINFLG
jgi:hypothetical protein